MNTLRLKQSFPYPIRMNENVKIALTQKAKENGYTFNGIVQVLIKKYLETTAKRFRVIQGEKKGYEFSGHKIDFKENELYILDGYGQKFNIEQVIELK